MTTLQLPVRGFKFTPRYHVLHIAAPVLRPNLAGEAHVSRCLRLLWWRMPSHMYVFRETWVREKFLFCFPSLCAELSSVVQERKDASSRRRRCEEHPDAGLSRFTLVGEPAGKQSVPSVVMWSEEWSLIEDDTDGVRL